MTTQLFRFSVLFHQYFFCTNYLVQCLCFLHIIFSILCFVHLDFSVLWSLHIIRFSIQCSVQFDECSVHCQFFFFFVVFPLFCSCKLQKYIIHKFFLIIVPNCINREVGDSDTIMQNNNELALIQKITVLEKRKNMYVEI